MKRIFVYDKREFPDPDPAMTVEEVKDHMAGFFPELSTATVKDLGERPAKAPIANAENAAAVATETPAVPVEAEHLWEFERKVGTKGAKFSFFKKEKISVELSPLEISIIASSMQPKCPVEGIGMVATRVEAKAINFEDLPDAIKAKIKETMEAQGKEQTGG